MQFGCARTRLNIFVLLHWIFCIQCRVACFEFLRKGFCFSSGVEVIGRDELGLFLVYHSSRD